jgi:hypothetical protein
MPSLVTMSNCLSLGQEMVSVRGISSAFGCAKKQVNGSSQEMCNHMVALDPASMNVTCEGWISH